jgi:hypothetical protein
MAVACGLLWDQPRVGRRRWLLRPGQDLDIGAVAEHGAVTAQIARAAITSTT